jgi:HK97 family phage major capsid protein
VNLQLEERRMNELSITLSEAETLSSLPHPTSQQRTRISVLLAKISALKSGVPIDTVRNFERARMLEAAGLRQAPARATGRLEEDVAFEWREFAKGQPVKESCLPPALERRAYSGELAGAQSVTSAQGALGSYFVPPSIAPRLYESLKLSDDVFSSQFCHIVETANGAVCPFPMIDDLGNDAVITGEGTSSVEATIANVTNQQMHAFAFRSKLICCSNELIADANWPIGEILERAFAKRLARGCGRYMISGTGVGQPVGLVTGALAAGATVVVANGSSGNTGGAETGATSIGTADIYKLITALNVGYRRGACLYMNPATYDALNQLVDKNGRPIVSFAHGTNGGASPQIYGYAVALCPSMSTMGAGNNSVIFAQPDNIIQRRVPSSVYIKRYTQAVGLAENSLTAFEEWMRLDSAFLSSNSAYVPAAILQSHS